ncbi:MAG: hypothetical protein QM776_02010 [Rhodocyclaceae bacterium]
MFPIIALGWLYVALMLAIGSGSIVAGVFAFLGWGVLPVGILWYLFARKRPPRDKPPAQTPE